jgi:signal transduction histidine kinase
MEPLDQARLMSGVGDIPKESEYMTRLIRDLLTLAVTDGDNNSPTDELFELGEAIAEVVARAEILAAAKNIEIKHQSAHHIVAIRGHRSEFERLVMIFMDNAIRYSPESSLITLSTWTTERECGFAVTDRGVGITKQDQERIFQRFYRVDSVRTPRDSGTALGWQSRRDWLKDMVARLWFRVSLDGDRALP